MIASIKDFKEFDNFNWSILPKSFVIKPVRGVEGSGIEIFYNQDKFGQWIKSDKSKFNLDDLKTHCANILDGKFTPYSDPDYVLFEERIKPHKAFKYYSYKGTPDVRIIVYNKVPIMAYLRLPTVESKGKANMAMGAIASGIDIANGTTTTSVQGKDRGGRGYEIQYVPGTKLPLSGLKIPYWDKMLDMSIESQIATKLGFLAIDFLIDREDGPKIVELTARPGLSIQIANQTGLRGRLRTARRLKIKSAKQGARIAKDLFGGEIEESIETISGKQLIGIYENITIYGLNGEEENTKAKIDTGADSTSIDIELAKKLGYEKIIEFQNKLNIPQLNNPSEANKYCKYLREKYIGTIEHLEDFIHIVSSHGISIRLKVKMKIKLGDLIFETKVNLFDRSHLNFKIIVGRKSLSQFLVEPSRKKIPLK